MTKYEFLIKYFERSKPEHHWIKNEFCMCGINTFCLKNCKIDLYECRTTFNGYAPRYTKSMFNKFKRNHPELFI